MFLCKPCHDASEETFKICAGLPSYGPCERCHKTTQTVDCHGNHNATLVAIRDRFLGKTKEESVREAEEELKQGDLDALEQRIEEGRGYGYPPISTEGILILIQRVREAKLDARNLAGTEEKLLRYIDKLQQVARNLCEEMDRQYYNAVLRIGSGGDDAKSVWAAKNDLRAVLEEKA
jgi:hypothetical protein